MTHKLTSRFVKAIPWTIGDAVISAIYGVGVVLLLGRLVSPTDVGVGGIALAVSQIIEGLTAFGIQEAVIRNRSGDTLATDTAYVLATGGSLIGCLACAALSAPMAMIFADHRLTPLLMVAGLILVANAQAIVPTAILARKLRASSLTRRFIFGKICGLTVLCVTGALRLGPWCLVLSGLAVSLGSLVSVYLGANRWPRFRFERAHAVALFSFGRLIALDTFVWICTTRLFALLFGFFHGTTALGYFQFGQRLVDEIASLLQTSFTRLGFSYFSGLDRGGANIRAALQAATRIMTTGSAAIYVGLALVAQDIVPTLFGPGWTPMIPYVRLLALAWAASFPFILAPPALKSKGRPDLLVRFGLQRGALTLAGCAVTGGLAPLYGAACWAAGMILTAPWSMTQISRHIGVSMSAQFRQMAPSLAGAAAMILAVLTAQHLQADASAAARLTASIAAGAAVYMLAVWSADPVLRGMIRPIVERRRRPSTRMS